MTAIATHVLTQADVDAGGVDNHATATGVPPTGQPSVDEDRVTIPLTPGSGIDPVKTGELSQRAESAAGDEIVYTFTAISTGSVSLADVSVSDELERLSEISYSWPGEPGVLEVYQGSWTVLYEEGSRTWQEDPGASSVRSSRPRWSSWSFSPTDRSFRSLASWR